MQVSLSSFSSFTLFFMFCAFVAWADPTPPPPIPIQAAPVDGGIGYLIAAGLGYGIKKIYDRKKQQNSDNHL